MLEGYFIILLNILLDQNNRRAIIHAQDIFCSLFIISNNKGATNSAVLKLINEAKKCGKYAINRLRRQSKDRTELSEEEIGKLKIYLQVLDGLHAWNSKLRNLEASLDKSSLTGAFYHKFLHQDLSI